MFCKYCGTKIPDDARFCPACGRQTTDTDHPDRNSKQSTFNTEKFYGGGASQFQEGFGSHAGAVTDMGKSSLTLAFAIVFSAEILFSLIGYRISFLNVIALITEVIVCVGCWLVYVNSSQNRDSSTGFSVLRIGVPLYLAFSVVELFVSLVTTARWYFGILRLLVVIFYLAVIVVSVWCYCGLCRATSDGRKILRGESAEWRVSLSCVVILIILTVFAFFGAVTAIVFFSNAAVTLANILYALTLLLADAILIAIRRQRP